MSHYGYINNKLFEGWEIRVVRKRTNVFMSRCELRNKEKLLSVNRNAGDWKRWQFYAPITVTKVSFYLEQCWIMQFLCLIVKRLPCSRGAEIVLVVLNILVIAYNSTISRHRSFQLLIHVRTLITESLALPHQLNFNKTFIILKYHAEASEQSEEFCN